MKRSDMVLDIASELVHEYTNLMPFDKAQELAEIILTRIEKEGMLPPAAEFKPISHEMQWGFDPGPRSVWANKWEEEQTRDYCGAV